SLQYEFAKRQRRNWLDLQWRILQIGQWLLWGGGLSVAVGLFPQTRWLQPLIFAKPLIVIVTVVVTYIAMRLSRLSIDRFFATLENGEFLDYRTSRRRELRFNTLAPVLKSIAALTCVAAGILAGLWFLGVNISPLIAGAGLVGLAFSFAAQSVLKDAINGFLILMEDQFAVGDVIVVNGKDGFVEYMNLRITQLRNPEGRLITIPNSEITVVENLSKEWSRVDLTVTVAGDADPDRAMETIHRVGETLYRDPDWRDRILELPDVLGIDRLDSEGMLIRTWIKTQPLQQWNVAREFRRRLKLALDEAGVEIGLPHQAIVLNRGNSHVADGKGHNSLVAN
ncbi:MAG: mechanosensitive ion channel family protein, partial [Cyanobacteria bacterium J055]